jgi:hypothetical protein
MSLEQTDLGNNLDLRCRRRPRMEPELSLSVENILPLAGHSTQPPIDGAGLGGALQEML